MRVEEAWGLVLPELSLNDCVIWIDHLITWASLFVANIETLSVQFLPCKTVEPAGKHPVS